MVVIRPYQTSDRSVVERICADAGFLGEPIDCLFSDRELFCELMLAPYLDLVPECALVAEVAGSVVGYRVGVLESSFEWSAFFARSKSALKIAAKLMVGAYQEHPQNKNFVDWLFFRSYFEQPRRKYQAHGHYSVEKDYRGQGIGHLLVKNFEGILRANGVAQYSRSFYLREQSNLEEKLIKENIIVFDKVETTFFKPLIKEKMYLASAYKILA